MSVMAITKSVRRSRPRRQTDEDPMVECAKTCHQTLTYCLEQGGDHAQPDHVKTLVDCGDICTWTATLHHRQSEFVDQAMELCAEACKSCAEACEQFEGDETMQACAEACQRCYEHCVGG